MCKELLTYMDLRMFCMVKTELIVLIYAPMPKRAQDLYTNKFYIGGICFMLGCAKPLDVLLVNILVLSRLITSVEYFMSFHPFFLRINLIVTSCLVIKTQP